MNNDQLKIAIVEPSVIIRSGISLVLKRIPGYRIQPIEIISVDSINHYLNIHKPDILIINPTFWGNLDISKIKAESENIKLKCLALVNSPIDVSILRNYEDTLSIYDSVEQLKGKLDKLLDSIGTDAHDESNNLSGREKEIIVCIVKGLTNKEIAKALFLSVHTVMSHRRNITRKLEIHSSAGLTVFAIMNKLIEIDDIKKDFQI